MVCTYTSYIIFRKCLNGSSLTTLHGYSLPMWIGSPNLHLLQKAESIHGLPLPCNMKVPLLMHFVAYNYAGAHCNTPAILPTLPASSQMICFASNILWLLGALHHLWPKSQILSIPILVTWQTSFHITKAIWIQGISKTKLILSSLTKLAGLLHYPPFFHASIYSCGI